MLFSWLTPAALRGRTVRLARVAGMTVAVTSKGELIFRQPVGKAAALRRLRAWQVTVVPGTPQPIRSVLATGTTFQQHVWQACQAIPTGKTQTYGDLARRLRCRSAQAVGQALGANPLAQLIPCHRVTRTNGLSGFAWGTRRKNAWLKAESHELAR